MHNGINEQYQVLKIIHFENEMSHKETKIISNSINLR